MKITRILLILVVIFVGGCRAVEPEADVLEAPAFNEPASNEVEIHDHDSHSEDGAHEHDHVDEATAQTAVQVVLVPSELVVGQNRMAVGLMDDENQMIHDAEVHFHYFDLTKPDAPQLEQEADARLVQSPDGLTTVYVQERRFERAGEWGLEVQARFAGGETAVKRIKFSVVAESASILPGEAAPRLHTPTLADVDADLTRLTSAQTPNPGFYELSLDEALGNGKPTVLLLATPAFCQTRFCGPSYEIGAALQAKYGDAANFTHVEVYAGLPDPSKTDWQLSPVMAAFGLTTEPWVYVMDAAGDVVYRAEGVFIASEIEAYLE